jgi:hypothetical protein
MSSPEEVANMAEPVTVAHGWSLEVTALVARVHYVREGPAGRVREAIGVVDLSNPDSIARYLDALDSPRAASATEAALRLAVADSAERWHRQLNRWRRRPRVAATPQPAAPTDEPA